MSSNPSCLPRAVDVAAAGCGPSSRRRDHLADLERNVQKMWNDKKVYEASASPSQQQLHKEKYFCTFPYPYMNGRIHLGHAFTVTKAEFQARYQRLKGKNVLWPFAFHCTGMPISACADMLTREIAARNSPVEITEPVKIANCVEDVVVEMKELGKFSGKKSKAVAKTGVAKSQWAVMAASGVPEELIPKFQDAQFWLQYFPALAKEDLQRFGLAADWRRSFVTTDRNLYYDAFIRWQFHTLKQRGHIKFGTRPAIFSRIDGQPCTDHDRASGEGSNPQEYTLIKLKVKEIPPSWSSSCPELEGRELFLVAATLRPETMYGQTNCYVLPDGGYGLYLALNEPDRSVRSEGVTQLQLTRSNALNVCNTVFVCSRRSACNMAYQGILPVDLYQHQPHCIMSVTGTDMMGLPLAAPKAKYPTVYVLPMMGISMEKGTGVVTSVPSDSPDDYAALRDLQDKPAMRVKYGLTAYMVNFDVVDIIDTPGLGQRAAVTVCIAKKIKSQNDTVLLAAAKEEIYKKSFYEGVMLVGSQTGKKVSDAKASVRNELIAEGNALSYFEPERKVISRSGDDCVVALCDQWYIDYSDVAWTDRVMKYVKDNKQFSAYSERCLNQFIHVVGWLREWACSRHYGLGTCIPWIEDLKILIESLSDSTIYTAYYTIAHMLQGDLYGDVPGQLGITPDMLSNDVFDYIFMQCDEIPTTTSIPKEKLKVMRDEFDYWYPMDLRVSGKDLIFNHLTMSLFNHAAIWVEKQDSKWPKSFFCNGHILVDAEKMSKSAGNFLTLEAAIESFTADGTRVGLADAGDGLDDANFQKESANAALMKLYLLDAFVDEILKSDLRHGVKSWADRAFENQIIGLTAEAEIAYEKMAFRDALKACFFYFGAAKDHYRHFCGADGMHHESIMMWIKTEAVILSPIAPHICENIWTCKLKMPGFVIDQPWPTFNAEDKYDVLLNQQLECVLASLEEFRKAKDKSATNRKAGACVTDSAVIYVAKEYLPWQQTVLKILQSIPLDESKRSPIDSGFMSVVKNNPEIVKLDKKLMKDVMSFASYRMKEELSARGQEALELQLPFDEEELMNTCKEFIQRSLGLDSVHICWSTADKHPQDSTDRQHLAVPSKPSIVFWSSAEAHKS